MNKPKSDEELAREAEILTDQAERFVKQFEIDLSGLERFTSGSPSFRAAANAFDRIAHAEKTVDSAVWFKATKVDGRTSRDIMDRLWKVREHLRERDEAKKHSK